jgi:hypothetical protein
VIKPTTLPLFPFIDPPKPRFDGRTFSPPLDQERLETALGRVYELMKDGQWRTLREIAQATGVSEAGASARLRDFRKPKFQQLYPVSDVKARRVGRGLWQYRIVLNQG